jgi:hypothetical protein
MGTGALMLAIGLVAAFFGPLEIYPFYLFSEGGRFHYDGFGFGSFMFGNIATQVLGYYIVAALLLPLGYGHVLRRRWARTLFLALVYCWLVVGAPLAIVLLFTLFSVKELGPAAGIAVTVLVAASYAVLPWVLLRLYNGQNVRLTFETADERTYSIEKLPMPVLVLGCLFVFYAVVLHIPILFNSPFPLFGTWLSALHGTLVLDGSILCAAGLAWGTFKRMTWAWWVAIAFFGLLTVSAMTTLWRTSYSDLLSVADFPPFEMDILSAVPLRGVHVAAFVGAPLLLTVGLIIHSRKHFGASPGPATDRV